MNQYRFRVLISIAFTCNAAAQLGPVQTESGTISGTGSVISAFKGIPFAASPSGPLRWKPPQPAAKWDGTRSAAEFGPACPQGPQQIDPGTPTSEDCLSLNVWSPARSPGEKLPVMVWIHGGAFIGGSSSQVIYDGEPLARKGVIVVSMNYRLGVLGFLAHPQLSDESEHNSSGNYALQDVIAALQWVRRNVGQFGGDPGKVTLFGESAGGALVSLLLISPESGGLFQAAIVESPGGIDTPISHRSENWFGRPSAETAGKKLSREIGELRALSVPELLKRAAPSLDAAALGDFGAYVPIVDGWIIPDDPGRLLEAGKIHDVPVIAGANLNEGTLFTAAGVPFKTVESYRKFLSSLFGPFTGRLMKLYPVTSNADIQPVYTQILGDFGFVHSSRSVVRAAAKKNGKGYQYFFTRVNSLGRGSGYGAFHGSEIAYVFSNLSMRSPAPISAVFQSYPLPDREEVDRRLSEVMSDTWVRFARTGDPNGGDLPLWLAWDRSAASYLEFGDSVLPRQNLLAEKLGTFDRVMMAGRLLLIPQVLTGFVAPAIVAVPQYPGSDQMRRLPVPLLNLEYRKRLFLAIGTTGVGAAAGVNLIKTPIWTLALNVGGEDRRPEARGDALLGMGDREVTFSTGALASYRKSIFVQSVAVSQGLNNDGGLTGTVSTGIDLPLGFKGIASVRGIATVVNAREMRFDFGITQEQAIRRQAIISRPDPRLRPGEAGPFTPGGGIQSAGGSASIVFLLSKSWLATVYVSALQLAGNAVESPLVKERTQVTSGFGLGYRF